MNKNDDYIDEIVASYLVQKEQRDRLEDRLSELKDGVEELARINNSNSSELDALIAEALKMGTELDCSPLQESEELRDVAEDMLMLSDEEKCNITAPDYGVIEIIDTNSDWDTYSQNVRNYADRNGVDLSKDPFDQLLTQTEKNRIAERIREDYLLQKAHCDKYDYIIAAFCGCVSGLIDSFFVGAPSTNKSELSLMPEWTDRKADGIVQKTAQALWKSDSKKEDGTIKKKPETLQQCIQYLENRYKVNYDLPHSKDWKNGVEYMRPGNHHAISLGHYPDLVGLIFSILDQFTGQGTFIDKSRIVHKDSAKESKFELRGKNFAEKILFGVINWLGHLCSDLVGSNSTRAEMSEGRGSGLPAPFTEILQMCNFKVSGKTIHELALDIYEEGYDARFAAATAIPVLINEFLIRLLWSMKSRFYHSRTWAESVPFGNKPELRRMLLVGHGVLCTVDAFDASIRSHDVMGFMMHLNIVAWSRLAISGLQEVRALYAENVMNITEVDQDLEKEWMELYREVVLQ